jgi:hypothetical protein
LAGKTEEVLGENLSERYFVHHKSHMTGPGLETGPSFSKEEEGGGGEEEEPSNFAWMIFLIISYPDSLYILYNSTYKLSLV